MHLEKRFAFYFSKELYFLHFCHSQAATKNQINIAHSFANIPKDILETHMLLLLLHISDKIKLVTKRSTNWAQRNNRN